MSQLFTSGGQTIGASASASVFLINIQGWFPLGLTGLISLQSKGFSGVFSSTTIWKHQFFSAQLPLWPNSHVLLSVKAEVLIKEWFQRSQPLAFAHTYKMLIFLTWTVWFSLINSNLLKLWLLGLCYQNSYIYWFLHSLFRVNAFSSVLSYLNKNLKLQTLETLECHSSWTDCVIALGSWTDRAIALRSRTDHVIALRQTSVTAPCYRYILSREKSILDV